LKTLLSLTAILEGTTGLALLFAPALVVSILLGSSLVEPSGILVGRLTGLALISLTIMCWLYRGEENHAGGVVKVVLFYNVATATLLVYAGTSGFPGVAIWSVSLLHAGMAIWCMTLLRKVTAGND
jgi:hypothetical protein